MRFTNGGRTPARDNGERFVSPTFTALLADVVRRLSAQGLDASVEHPGCVVVQHADGSGRAYWFGVANPPAWMGDLMTADGGALADPSITLDVPTTSTDAGRIASAIAAALLEDRQ